MRIFAALAPAALLALGACVTQGNVPSGTPNWDGEEKARVLDLLGQSAKRSAAAQETLAMIERTRTKPTASPIDETGLPPDLKRPTTMDWSGPGEDAVRQIARLIGYEFRTTGNKPSVPPMIEVSFVDKPVAKALEDIGLQVQPSAQVVVDPNVRRIEFRYLPGAGASLAPTAPASSAKPPKPSVTK
jgi:defect-in-organelle-trafficking protein DotD